MDYAELDKQRCELAKVFELWQFRILDPRRLKQFARDRNIQVFDEHTIEDLWRVGLLRADLVTSEREIDVPSLTLVREENGSFHYCDVRPVPHREGGYGGIFSEEQPELNGIELHFHPFRLYVLYHVCRVFAWSVDPVQYLRYPEGLVSLSGQHIESKNNWSASAQFVERMEHWNRVSELAIVVEPIAYTGVFHSIHWRDPDTAESIDEKLNEWRDQTKAFLCTIPRQDVENFRQNLCQDAEIIDDNKIVHVLLRLMAANERLKLQSSIGAGMLWLCMAEIIRRAVEEATGDKLPEEDELGFGEWMPDARKTIYGSERILDASNEVRRDFLTSMGLDYGVKIRCYLEGETEYGAILSAVRDGAGTELINLKGHFLEKKGKGLAFVEALKNDIKSHVFSIVLLDSDNADSVRALKKAAKDGSFFGRFFVSAPDFEFGNFSLDELVDAVMTLAGRDRDELPSRDDILSKVGGTDSGKAFLAALKDTELDFIEMSVDWGAALMSYAVKHPEFPQGHSKAGDTRPVIDAARSVLIARQSGYERSRVRYRVDPESGTLHEK